MGKVGFKVLHKDARRMLGPAGAIVKDKNVKISEYVTRQCLETAQRDFPYIIINRHKVPPLSNKSFHRLRPSRKMEGRKTQ